LHLVLVREPPKANCHHPKDTHASYQVDNKFVVELNPGGVIIGTTFVILSIIRWIDVGIDAQQFGDECSNQNDGGEDDTPHPDIPLPAVLVLNEHAYHVNTLHGHAKGIDGEHGLKEQYH
jgi:hypothetical protein